MNEETVPVPTAQREVIWGRFTSVRPVLSQVFGRLVALAAPNVELHHGDLYHDALWLEKHASGRSFRFLWSVGDAGTSIGTDELLAMKAAESLGHSLIARVTIQLNEKNQATLTVERFALRPHAGNPGAIVQRFHHERN